MVRHKDTPASLFKELWNTIKSGQVFEGVIKNKAKNGGTYIVEAKIFPLVDENNVVHYVSVRTDITKYAQNKDKQILTVKQTHNQKLEESKDKMLTIFTHELKTPLNGIIGFSEVLSKRLNRALKKSVTEKDIHKYIDMSDDINALGHILYSSVISLLDSAKLKDGKYEVEKSHFKIKDYLVKFTKLYSRIYHQEPKYDIDDFIINSH